MCTFLWSVIWEISYLRVPCQNLIGLEQIFLSGKSRSWSNSREFVDPRPKITAPGARASYASRGWRADRFGDGNRPWRGWRSLTGAGVSALLGADGTGRLTRAGEGDGGVILCVDSGHDRGRPALASVAAVNLNENERARERVGQLFLKRFQIARHEDQISPQSFESGM
jgi:hypothetical protein